MSDCRRRRSIGLQVEEHLCSDRFSREASAQIAALSSEDVLPDRLITKKGQYIGDQLPGAMKLTTNCGDEDEGARRHRKAGPTTKLMSSLQARRSGAAHMIHRQRAVALAIGVRSRPDGIMVLQKSFQ